MASDPTLDDKIKEAEKLRNDLEELAVLERRMAEVLPVRFERNREAIKKYFPELYRRFENYHFKGKWQFFCSLNGEVNLKNLETGVPFYAESPFAEAKKLIDEFLKSSSYFKMAIGGAGIDPRNQSHLRCYSALAAYYREIDNRGLMDDHPVGFYSEIPMCYMFGIGLGYQLGYLYEKIRVRNLYILEPNPDLLYASFYTFDWYTLLPYLSENGDHIYFYTGDFDQDRMMRDQIAFYSDFPGFVRTYLPVLATYESKPILETYRRFVNDVGMLQDQSGFFDDYIFGLSGALASVERKVPFLRNLTERSKLRDLPCVVVGNGPSLDASVDFLRQVKDRAVIIACGTAVTALEGYGIKPHIYVAVERLKNVAESLDNLKDPHFLDDVLLIGTEVLHPDTVAHFRHRVLMLKQNEMFLPLLMTSRTMKRGTLMEAAYINPLVSNMGTSAAVNLGFHDIYLVGIDCGARDESRTHSSKSYYYDDKGQMKKEYSDNILNRFSESVPGNFGGEVRSNYLFKSSVSYMGALFSENRESIRVFNLSDGARIPGTEPLRSAEVDFSAWKDVDRSGLFDYLEHEESMVLDTTPEKLLEFMPRRRLQAAIDWILQGWQKPPKDLGGFISLLTEQQNFIRALRYSTDFGVYMMLSGTLNACFSVMNRMLFSLEDPEPAAGCINVLRYYFREYMAIFDQIRDYHDGSNIAVQPYSLERAAMCAGNDRLTQFFSSARGEYRPACYMIDRKGRHNFSSSGGCFEPAVRLDGYRIPEIGTKASLVLDDIPVILSQEWPELLSGAVELLRGIPAPSGVLGVRGDSDYIIEGAGSGDGAAAILKDTDLFTLSVLSGSDEMMRQLPSNMYLYENHAALPPSERPYLWFDMEESPEELASLTLGRHLYPKFLRTWRITVIPYSSDERWAVFEDKVRQIYPGFLSGTLGLFRGAAENIGLIPAEVRKAAAERIRGLAVSQTDARSPRKAGRVLTECLIELQKTGDPDDFSRNIGTVACFAFRTALTAACAGVKTGHFRKMLSDFADRLEKC
ncbi:MAG: 6-hydroxymethylpterin diphosphokinase MptE-like protein [Succinivibrionaceae bacterium]|nr:6-hydroxymethylpterin diphosphokinase MptE-like protein [Succinivibrionaceae bacterium]MDY6377010.1 6-hydroxymethylpterin diphosphokinase MptE-like protein [Succinivibrionaceae bacterium]